MSQSTVNGDIKLFQPATTNDWADIKLDSNFDLILDDGFETSVLISIGTDARAKDADNLDYSYQDKKGYWGDSLISNSIGSQMWQRSRLKLSPALLASLKQDLEESMQWMLDDGICDSIEINVQRDTFNANRVVFSIQIIKDNTLAAGYKYYYNWQNQILART